MEAPLQIDPYEWAYCGCFIQEQTTVGSAKYCVFKNDKSNTTVGYCETFEQATQLCESHAVPCPFIDVLAYLNANPDMENGKPKALSYEH